MSSNQMIIHVAAGADLSGANGQYRALAIGGTLVTTTLLSRGILQNKPKSGEDASLVVAGLSKFQAGGTITAGARLKCTSGGWFTVAASGDQTVGFSRFAVASGAFSPGDGGVFDFSAIGYFVA